MGLNIGFFLSMYNNWRIDIKLKDDKIHKSEVKQMKQTNIINIYNYSGSFKSIPLRSSSVRFKIDRTIPICIKQQSEIFSTDGRTYPKRRKRF